MSLFLTTFSVITDEKITIDSINSNFMRTITEKGFSLRSDPNKIHINISNAKLGNNIYVSGFSGSGYASVYTVPNTPIWWRVSLIRYGNQAQITISRKDIQNGFSYTPDDHNHWTLLEEYILIDKSIRNALAEALLPHIIDVPTV